MVISKAYALPRQRGSLMTEAVVAIAILTFALFPLAYSIVGEKRLARATYQRAIAMQIVDGELEVLAAGGWRSCSPGMCEYRVRAGAATNLPPGRFLLSISASTVRLEWLPAVKNHGGAVAREVAIR